MRLMYNFRDKTTGRIYYEPVKLILFVVMWRFLFKDKTYPAYLYNLVGSEGDSNTRQYVDNLIQVNGFWTAVKIIIANAT